MTTASTSPLLAFIRARLADDKKCAETARTTGTGKWASEGIEIIDGHPRDKVCESWHGDDLNAHIVQQNPVRVLRQVVALSSIVAEHTHAVDDEGTEWCGGLCYREDRPYEDWGWPCSTLRAIASIWADYPDYDPVWASSA